MPEYVLTQHGVQIIRFFSVARLQEYIRANFKTENLSELRKSGFVVREITGKEANQ